VLMGLFVAIAEEEGMLFLIFSLLFLMLAPFGALRLSGYLQSQMSMQTISTDEEVPILTPAPSVPFESIREWLVKQAWLIGLFLGLIPLATTTNAGYELCLLPSLLIAARLLYMLISTFVNQYGEQAPNSVAAIRRLSTIALTFLPPLLWLRSLGSFPEFLFLGEFTLKILLVLPAYALFRHREELLSTINRVLPTIPSSTDQLLGWVYRACTALLVPGLLLAIYGYQNLALWFLLKLCAIIGVLALLSIGRPVADRLAEHWFLVRPESGSGEAPISFLHILTRKLLRFLIWVIALAALIKIFGLSRDFPLLSPLTTWIAANGSWVSGFLVKLGLILGMVVLSLDFCATIGESILAYVRQTEHLPNTESERRASTLVQIFRTTTRVLIFGIAGIMVLQEIGVDIKPLLTGAGILGVAIGFGSQSLIKDFFSGFFILVENQFRVGDVIDVNGKAGVVEKINLKTTVLRAVDGSIFIIPNGEITSVKNMTFAWSRAVLEIGVSYDADLDKTMEVLQRIGDELRFHPSTKGNIIERPEVTGVERLEDSSVVLRLLVKTKPLSQWEIARVFRKRILEVFRQE
ncbi:MAG TPA: mechanosensitive ion channel, partial [Candidatus Ozemobacteraceae bacterium]|nr:mechanosensitive ion channel [Candidatus Ozemobacteraceae bacterium]